MTANSNTPDTYKWTPETANLFEDQYRKSRLDSQGSSRKTLVDKFNAPERDHNAFLLWRGEMMRSLMTYRIQTGKDIEIIREEQENLDENNTRYELGFKVDGKIYNVISDTAREMKTHLDERHRQGGTVKNLTAATHNIKPSP